MPEEKSESALPEWLREFEYISIGGTTCVEMRAVSERYSVTRVYCGWVVLNHASDLWVKFAVVEFAQEDDHAELGEVIFHGEGTREPLRECRHTWWGSRGGGYVFYPNGRMISEAFEVLSAFFDDMVAARN